MKIRWTLILVVGFLFLLGPPGMVGKATGEETIRVGVPLLPTVAVPQFIASDNGFFQKKGLRVSKEAKGYHGRTLSYGKISGH